MSHYLVLFILEFLPARLAMLLYGLDSNVTRLVANLLTRPSVFYYLPIVPCNLVSIKWLLLLLLLFYCSKQYSVQHLSWRIQIPSIAMPSQWGLLSPNLCHNATLLHGMICNIKDIICMPATHGKTGEFQWTGTANLFTDFHQNFADI